MPEAKKAEEAPKITPEEVTALFTRWNDALATEDPVQVAKLYSKNAVLLPTVSDRPRTDYQGIRDYFVDFLKKKPQGVIVKDNIMIGNGFAKDAGVYQVRILYLICLKFGFVWSTILFLTTITHLSAFLMDALSSLPCILRHSSPWVLMVPK